MSMRIGPGPDMPGFPPGDPDRAARVEAMARHLAAEEAGGADPEAVWRRLLDGERTRFRRRADALLRAAESAVRSPAPRPGRRGRDA